MTYKKKQHYVPQCYLDRFSKNGQVFYYSKKRNKHGTNNKEDICESNYFYLIQERKWWNPLDIENFFDKFVETKLGFIIKSLEEKVHTLVNPTKSVIAVNIDENFRSTMATFMFLQFYRTPRFRKMFTNKQIIRKGISSSTHTYIEETIKDVALVHALGSFLNKKKLETAVEYLSNNKWVILYSPDVKFLTSDNPVVWMPIKSNESELITLDDVDSKRCNLFYPITPQIAIQVIDKDLTCVPSNYDNCIILSDNEQVWCLNMNTILAADDLVILNDLPITNYFPTIELKIF